MRTITVDVPDDLADRLTEAHERLPELLAFSLQQPALPAQLYRTLLAFLASDPTPVQITAFARSPDLQYRLQLLLERSRARDLTATGRAELDEFERIEHVIVMLKTGVLSALTEPWGPLASRGTDPGSLIPALRPG